MPDKTFSGGIKVEKRVVSLVVDFDDGTRDILEFADDNRAFYRVVGVNNDHEPQHNVHQIWWRENHEA